MTTRVTIDAHAGWPVQVVSERGEPGYEKAIQVDVVPPKTTRDFYIHSGLRILSVIELPLPKVEAAKSDD